MTMGENPWLARRKTMKHGQKAESRAATRLKVRQTIASGAFNDKGDIDYGDLLIDSKSTIHESISLKREMLKKITKEGEGKGMVGVILLQFVNPDGTNKPNGSWCVMPEFMMRRLMEGYSGEEK